MSASRGKWENRGKRVERKGATSRCFIVFSIASMSQFSSCNWRTLSCCYLKYCPAKYVPSYIIFMAAHVLLVFQSCHQRLKHYAERCVAYVKSTVAKQLQKGFFTFSCRKWGLHLTSTRYQRVSSTVNLSASLVTLRTNQCRNCGESNSNCCLV